MQRLVIILALFFSLLIGTEAYAKGKAMDFDLPTPFGGQVRLSDFRGRVVVLDFMASWCRPCLQAIPHLNELAKKYKSKGLSVIGFDVDEPPSKVRTMMARYKVEFPVVLGSLREARRFAPVTGLPTTVIIDPEGRVVARYTGRQRKGTFANAASRYFKKSAPKEPFIAREEVHTLPQYRGRFGRIWVMDNEKLNNQNGLSYYIEVNVADMLAVHGLWLELNIQPEGPDYSGMIKPMGPTVKLYKRIDDVGKSGHKLFIGCNAFPEIPRRGSYRTWFNLLDSNKQQVEKSGYMVFSHPPCKLARAN